MGDDERLGVRRFRRYLQGAGVDFDKVYYESQTYLLGKDIVQKGLDMGIFYRREDGSVWIDLTADGLDQKLLLRATERRST